MKNKLICFLDGDSLCIARPDFINLQESTAFFIKLSEDELIWITALEESIND